MKKRAKKLTPLQKAQTERKYWKRQSEIHAADHLAAERKIGQLFEAIGTVLAFYEARQAEDMPF